MMIHLLKVVLFHRKVLNCQSNVPFPALGGFTITIWSFGGEAVLVSHPSMHSC